MSRIKLPAKLGACRYCIRTSLVGLGAALAAYLLVARLADGLLPLAALAVAAAFGALSLAHAVAFGLRRLGWAYSPTPCCAELVDRAERYQALRSRRALLGKAVAVTGSVLLLDLFTGALGGRRAAHAHEGTHTEVLSGSEAEKIRDQMSATADYQEARSLLLGKGYAPKIDELAAIVTRTTNVDGRAWTQVTLPFIAGGQIDRAGSLVAVRDQIGNMLVLGLVFTDGPQVLYASDGFSRSEIEAMLNAPSPGDMQTNWHRHCFGFVCINYCTIVCAALSGACGVGCGALCASVCPPCTPFCAGICGGVCAGVCNPTCESLGH